MGRFIANDKRICWRNSATLVERIIADKTDRVNNWRLLQTKNCAVNGFACQEGKIGFSLQEEDLNFHYLNCAIFEEQEYERPLWLKHHVNLEVPFSNLPSHTSSV